MSTQFESANELYIVKFDLKTVDENVVQANVVEVNEFDVPTLQLLFHQFQIRLDTLKKVNKLIQVVKIYNSFGRQKKQKMTHEKSFSQQ